MRNLSVEQNRDLLRVMYHRLVESNPRAKYVTAMMKVYSRVYSTTLDQMWDQINVYNGKWTPATDPQNEG